MSFYRNTLYTIVCLFFCATQAQQISIDNTLSEQELIENNFVLGCVEASNIQSQYNGQVNGFNSFGYFERAGSNFPFENGIMLSTGNAISGGNSLNTAVLNEGTSNWETDPDLEDALGISGTLNATSIEFDFISAANLVQFNYILASEEYFGNFPCQYSDGFALLIKEANSSDPYENIAVIPGTTIPVNTNTIHDEIVGFCSASNEEYFDGFNVGDTNFNGRTEVLTAMASIQPNVLYHIKLVIADQTDKNYDSAVFIQGNSFNATVDLGEDIQTCAANVLLDANISNPDATYSWYFNDNLITGANQSTFNVSQTGEYRVEIEIPLAGSTCIIEDEIMVTLSSTQSAELIDAYELCDDPSGDEIELFDLSTKDNEVLASVPESDYVWTYHLNATDALDGSNPVVGAMQNTSNPQTVFVRIEDVINGCLAYQSFDLIVNPLPIISQPTILIACDDVAVGGLTTIDLSQKDEEITNGNFDLNVTYHLTQEDANNGANAIALPYANTSTNETLYVNVTDSNTGCSTITTLVIEVLNNPVINTEEHYIDACDTDHNGVATFDLTSVTNDVLEGLSGMNVTFHETQEDADLGVNPIPNPSNYTNTTLFEQTVYIRVENPVSGCATITPIEIHTNLLLTATNIIDITACDENNDGIEEFNFANITAGFLGDLEEIMEYDIDIQYYLTEDDRDTGNNPIDISEPFIPSENPQTIYITITSPTCQEVAEFDVVINPVAAFGPADNQIICDTDQDGFTVIDLSTFDVIVTNGQTDLFSVTYYGSQEDADNDTNALPTLYTNVTNPQTIFPKIALNTTGCGDVNSFSIEVLPAPSSNDPTDIIICDDDLDGVSTINLNNKILEMVSDTSDKNITFHNTLEDAESGSNAISNINSYPSSTETLFSRIENINSGCFTTHSFEIIVNTLPEINPISLYKFCELGDDQLGEFVFATQDEGILGDQTGKEVFYFETAQDAENNENAIDKENTYVNTSNPQTIYVRVENITDPECYTTSSFSIEVGTNPEYNEPSDIFICDDATNDGSVTFDFSVQFAEISQGYPNIEDISFHTSQINAENNIGQLPMNFQNTVNPQQIYVRINNGSICESYDSFVLNVIAAPIINDPQPLMQCDDDYDGITTFDLTVSEFDILDVRTDNIVITYHENFDDAFLGDNAIPDPTNYTNTSDPQTVYVRVTNTISNCFVHLPLELIVNLPPEINTINQFDICDNEANAVDLTEINSALLIQTTNVVVTYYASEDDARNQENALDNNYTYSSSNDLLFARAEFSTTHCFVIHSFTLNVNPLPIANQPDNLETCDDDYDGFYGFYLMQQDASILGGQNPNDFTVTYYIDNILAEEGEQALEMPYDAINNETIYARVENNITGCYDLTEFMVMVYPKPIVDIDDQVICLTGAPLYVSANTNNPGDSYLWSTGQTNPEITITEIGTYWVTVTTPQNCATTQVFNVSESETATIELTETIDFSDPNNITVTISGIGNYIYQLDDDEPQISNIFENVSLGYHTLTIIDLNGCAEVTKELLVIDAPKFVTPNDDGHFDTWHITGVETLPGTFVYIYDRYGKLLTVLDSNHKGWDGRYNGNVMPASDYWFVADVKKGSIQFQVKGHFALRL